MSANIIQWNINGFYNKLEELQLIIKDHNPSIICLQETNFNTKSNPALLHFNIFKKNRNICNRSSGGVAILVNHNFPTEEITLHTDLEAIALSITLPHITVTLCNIYIPNQKDFTLYDIEHIILQLPNTFVIVGDFNSHSETWGSYKTDYRGRIIEELLSNDSLVILNNGQPTRINPSNGHPSAIDLSITNASLSHKLEWNTLPDIYSSDHIPIEISITLPLDSSRLNYHPMWKIKNANWNLFSSTLEVNTPFLPPPSKTNITTDVANLTALIQDTAKISIGESFNKTTHKPRVPWWNDDIKKSIQIKNKALKTFQTSKTQEDFITLKRCKARTRFLVKNSKASSWKNFVSSIHNQTDSSIVWKKIKSIKGTNRSNVINLLIDSKLSTSPYEVANSLGRIFHENSSNANYDQDFLNYSQCYVDPVNSVDPLDSQQSLLNSPLKIEELEDALHNCKSKSPGPDGIPYSFIKNFPKITLNHLLAIYNLIWNSNVFPESWKHGHIIPILKPNKNKFIAESYRPICLLNTLCKLLEKIVNRRLIWFIENLNFLTPEQNGFRRNRCTMNNLLTIKNELHSSLNNKQNLGMISFDIVKAYDTAWRPRILSKLNQIIAKGHMLDFISNFLNHRTFQVKTSNTLSDIFLQESGVPQGSTISVTLFLIAINDISEGISRPNIPLLFADDFTILCRSTNVNSIQSILQDSTNRLTSWSKTSGFRFSPEKTNLIVFSHKRNKKKIQINIGNQAVENQPNVKILGITFDHKASWIPHILNLKNTTAPRLNIIKTLGHTSWGAKSQTLLRIHKALILSKLDYGAPIFSSAKHTKLKTLETIHNSGIRLSIGAFRSSPIKSILNIAGIPSLEVRWREQTHKLAARISRSPKNQIHHPKHTFNHTYIKYDLENIIPYEKPLCPPWQFNMNINIDLHEFPKNSTCPHIFKNLFRDYCSHIRPQTHIYTDASIIEGRVGMAIICDETTIQWKLSNKCSIYTAETLAILKAIEFTISEINDSNITIFSDSLSALTSLQNLYSPSDIVRKIQNTHFIAKQQDKNITYSWIPGHCNIDGNELADTAAKLAHSSPNSLSLPIFSLNDIKRVIENDTLLQCQKEWNEMSTKLNEIKRSALPYPSPDNISRKHETSINRLRIGHTHLTHSHLMKKEAPPVCTCCGTLLTVKHILTECKVYDKERRLYQISNHLAEALNPDPSNIHKIMQFLKQTNLINKL